MKREEELNHPSRYLSDDELLFRLRHIASDDCTGTVDGALDYAVADGALTRERANALRQALVDEGVAVDEGSVPAKKCDRHGGGWGDDPTCVQCTDAHGNSRPSAPRPGTVNHSAEYPRLDQRCKDCGYGVHSRSHLIQCHPLKTTAPVQNVNTPEPGPILGDAEALDLIARELSENEWSADTLDVIAAYVRGSGRDVEEPSQVDEP